MYRAQIFAASLLVLTVVAALAQQGTLESQILAKERRELDCLKSGNYTEFAHLVAGDAIFVDSHGASGKAEIIKHTAGFRLAEYTIEDVKFVPLSSKSGLLIYEITETGTSHDKQFTAKAYISALWAQRKGKWVCVYSQETSAR